MNEQTNFDADYRMLELQGNPDWSTTRNQYKKMVLKWHPDKYSSRPREIEHAKRMFIQITKSFNRIKAFHQQHNRMPLAEAPLERDGNRETMSNPANQRNASTRLHATNLDISTLSRDENKVDARLKKKSPLKVILWSGVACIVLVSTVAFFLMLDKRASQKNATIAAQAIKEAPKSDFIPSASEIRRSGSKGAFLGNGI